MGGNTRIFLELSKRWAEKEGIAIHVITNEERFETCKSNGLEKASYTVLPTSWVEKRNPYLYQLFHTIRACSEALRWSWKLQTRGEAPQRTIIYSASDMPVDVLPAVILKRKIAGAVWIASLFLFIPNPLRGYEHAYGGKLRLPDSRTAVYFLAQRSTLALIKWYSDLIFITNDFEKRYFTKRGIDEARIKAIYGGVNLAEIAEVPESEMKKYDGCFVGRIHPQKGLIDLVKIWEHVCKVRPEALLALIGSGAKEYEDVVRKEIRERGLANNVIWFGYKDGREKYEILRESKVFLHSTIYDNCGMAACEAMACGVPAVGYDIPALRVAYPKGMLKAPMRDHRAFARLVLRLLKEDSLYAETKRDALELAKGWDWERRAEDVWNFIISSLNSIVAEEAREEHSYSKTEEEKVMERLRTLGYFE
jgi:glycosyltransferase involved in cell wall biosynthesis